MLGLFEHGLGDPAVGHPRTGQSAGVTGEDAFDRKDICLFAIDVHLTMGERQHPTHQVQSGPYCKLCDWKRSLLISTPLFPFDGEERGHLVCLVPVEKWQGNVYLLPIQFASERDGRNTFESLCRMFIEIWMA